SSQEAGDDEPPSARLARDLYLDLLQKTLSFSLWPEPPVPVETYNYWNQPWKRRLVGFSANVAKRYGMQLVEDRRYTTEQREEGMIWPVFAHTMIGSYRLANLKYSVETVIKEGVEGDLIET